MANRQCTREVSSILRLKTPNSQLKPCDGNDRTQLLAAAAATRNENQPAVLHSLLTTGASIHDWDESGKTGLHLALCAARPEQTWVVRSLTTLLHAGLDPSQTDHAGINAFDIACEPSPEYGSFRKDLLLQALLESGSDILDERLLGPTYLTKAYTSSHNQQLCGATPASPDHTSSARTALMERLEGALDCKRSTSQSQLLELAVDRVRCSRPTRSPVNSEDVFQRALNYAKPMLAGRSHLDLMTGRRIAQHDWNKYCQYLDCSSLADRAAKAALLEFDWFRPVDPEDLWFHYVDHLVRRLEKTKAKGDHQEDVRKLIKIVESSTLSSREMSKHKIIKQTSAEVVGSPKITTQVTDFAIRRTRSATFDHSAYHPATADRHRQESMTETPVQFYVSDFGSDEGYYSASPAASSPSSLLRLETSDKSLGNNPSQEERDRQTSIVKTPLQFYLPKRPSYSAYSCSAPGHRHEDIMCLARR